jgi:hypothetical protein
MPRNITDIIADLRRDAYTVHVHSDAPERARIRDVMHEAAEYLTRVEKHTSAATTGIPAYQNARRQGLPLVTALRYAEGAVWLAHQIVNPQPTPLDDVDGGK